MHSHNMSYNLFLDDFRNPEDVLFYQHKPIYGNVEWHIVRNYDEFVKTIIEKGIPNIISFDHDIYYEEYDAPEKTGYDCALWLIDYCNDINEKLPSEIHVHSMNAVGCQKIKSLFNLK